MLFFLPTAYVYSTRHFCKNRNKNVFLFSLYFALSVLNNIRIPLSDFSSPERRLNGYAYSNS
nr:MAG TPA: hypothetical protein [Caudoviricetes sp.]